jgi:hypothetical protein
MLVMLIADSTQKTIGLAIRVTNIIVNSPGTATSEPIPQISGSTLGILARKLSFQFFLLYFQRNNSTPIKMHMKTYFEDNDVAAVTPSRPDITVTTPKFCDILTLV